MRKIVLPVALIALVFAAVLFLRRPAAQAEPDGPEKVGMAAPEFAESTQWLQSKPLTMASLRGQVVVVHFWTFGCINCIHNYPVYRAWQEKYAGKGVTLVGIHTPEFEREADVKQVGVKAERNAPLARLTTMRVGGPADLLATAHNTFELRALVRFARSRGLPLTLLGRGSNTVVSDRGVRGLVVHVRAEGSRVDGQAYVAEAGVPMARAATETQRAGLSGLEFGLAIPGTAGGAVWANAGARHTQANASLCMAEQYHRLAPPDRLFCRLDAAFVRLRGGLQASIGLVSAEGIEPST